MEEDALNSRKKQKQSQTISSSDASNKNDWVDSRTVNKLWSYFLVMVIQVSFSQQCMYE